MHKEEVTISRRYIRIDRSVLFYLMLKNNIEFKSKVYRFASMCMTRYHLKSVTHKDISKFCYRLYRLASKSGEDDLKVHNFIQDLSREYCRRINMCNFGLPKITIDMTSLNVYIEDITNRFGDDDIGYITENINAYFSKKPVGMLNLRVFEDVLLEYFRFKVSNQECGNFLADYEFVGNVVSLSKRIYTYYTNKSLNYI